jgi:F-type H+-transporting ATPase subunit delta
MATRLSRRKLAEYSADQLLAGKKETVLQELAAYLIEKKRVSELDLIIRDIEAALLLRGIAIADVVTARTLTSETQAHIEAFIASKHPGTTVQLRTRVEPDVLGGAKIGLAGEELDATIRRKLTTLKASKV